MKSSSGLAVVAIIALTSQGVASAAPRRPSPPEPIRMEPSTEIIAYTQRKPPGLTSGVEVDLAPAGYGLAGMVGAVIGKAIAEQISGAQLAKKSQLIDPTPNLARELAWTLAERRNAIVLEPPIVVERQKSKAIAKTAGKARYIIDIRNIGWSVVGSGTYEKDAIYHAKLNVIDGVTGAVAVNAYCRWESPVLLKSERALYRPDAGDLAKAHFAAAHEDCLGRFRIATRSLYPASTFPAQDSRGAPLVMERAVAETSRIETRIEPPAPVAMTALPPPAPIMPQGGIEPSARPSQPDHLIEPTPSEPASPITIPVVMTEIEQREFPPAHPLPPYVEYPYARPDEAPPSRTPPPEYRYAGRDANGYLVWPGKRP